MKATAPQALDSPAKKNGKPHGAKGPSSALERAPGKGKSSFLSLMSARAAAASKEQALPAAIENTRILFVKAAALAVAAPDGKKLPMRAPTAPVNQQVASAALALPEKTDLKKKTARLHSADSLSERLALSGPAATPGGQKTADVNKSDTAAGAAGVPAAAKQGTMRHAEPLIRVVDLRIKLKSEDSPAIRALAATAILDKDASVPLTQRLAGARDLSAEAPQKAAASAAAPAQTALERLQDMAGSELLRATNLVLKDGGGEIRLVLKPESLGSVRIRMNIVDNAIEGRIIVDSSAVKQAVDGSIDALRRALTAEGFQTGSLQVSVGGQNAETGGRKEQDWQPQPVRRIAAQGFGSNVPGVENVSLGDLLVNVFV